MMLMGLGKPKPASSSIAVLSPLLTPTDDPLAKHPPLNEVEGMRRLLGARATLLPQRLPSRCALLEWPLTGRLIGLVASTSLVFPLCFHRTQGALWLDLFGFVGKGGNSRSRQKLKSKFSFYPPVVQVGSVVGLLWARANGYISFCFRKTRIRPLGYRYRYHTLACRWSG